MSVTSTSPDRKLAKKVLQTEAAAILELVERIDDQFDKAIRLLMNCRGRVIVTGMGKSGIICRKIAATLSSTGTPAFFLHPAEAIHGDLGVIQSTDVVIALSYSGETEEILRLLETIKRLGASLIALTGEPNSTLGKSSTVTLNCHVSEEACPLNLVPTASTTAALALGDGLAMALLVTKGFRQEDFANLHPGGNLGKQLMRVEQLMKRGPDIPKVYADTPVSEVVSEISKKGLGMTCVIDNEDKLLGIITDGDLRRHMTTSKNILSLTASKIMTTKPLTVNPEGLAVEALQVMEKQKITALVVIRSGTYMEGVIHIHDLWRTEMF
tara:strand:+ start:4289 stop:5266 length:978 start_codon:yes stop_codon:yes gene_type:complete